MATWRLRTIGPIDSVGIIISSIEGRPGLLDFGKGRINNRLLVSIDLLGIIDGIVVERSKLVLKLLFVLIMVIFGDRFSMITRTRMHVENVQVSDTAKRRRRAQQRPRSIKHVRIDDVMLVSKLHRRH